MAGDHQMDVAKSAGRQTELMSFWELKVIRGSLARMVAGRDPQLASAAYFVLTPVWVLDKRT
jgi:hypothetical protein